MFENLNELTSAGLKKICRDERISGYSRMKKQELITHIKKNRIRCAIDAGIEKLMGIR